MSLFDQIRGSVNQLIESFQRIKADGKITLSELRMITCEAISEIVLITETLKASGEDKKKAAIQAFERFIDCVVIPLKLPFVPSFAMPVVHLILKRVLMASASGLIDAAVEMFNRLGWPEADSDEDDD